MASQEAICTENDPISKENNPGEDSDPLPFVEKHKVLLGHDREKDPVEIYYEIHGSGPCKILFVMGLQATSQHWKAQVEFFRQLNHVQICVFDNRGIGQSSTPKGPYSTKDMALDTLELLDHINWNSNIHLVGISLGGMIVQKMVTTRPCMFESVTLTSTYATFKTSLPTIAELKFFLKKFSKLNSSQKLKENLLWLCFSKNWLLSNSLSNSDVSNFDYLLMEMNQLGEVWNFKGGLAQFHAALLHHWNLTKLKQILNEQNIRFLVLHGGDDMVIRADCGKLLSQILDTPLELFTHAGHMINIECSDLFNRRLLAQIENKSFYDDAIRLISSSQRYPLPPPTVGRAQSFPLLRLPSLLPGLFRSDRRLPRSRTSRT